MLARKLQSAIQFLREPGGEAGDMGRMGMAYSEYQGQELWKKTIGLIGLGAIGRKVAQRLRPYGVRILGYDPYLPIEDAPLMGVTLVSLEDLLSESDFVSLHVPVTEETRGMLGEEEFALMKPGAFFVNTARAALIDEVALLRALESERLSGAALDVFSVEPPGADDPLLGYGNVIATPHVGGNTYEVSAHQGEIILSDVLALLRDQQPRHILNPDSLVGFDWNSSRREPHEGDLLSLQNSSGPAVSDLEAARPDSEERDGLDIKKTDTKGGIVAGIRKLIRKDSAAEKEQSIAMTNNSAVEKMSLIIDEFVRLCSQDVNLQDFAKGKSLTMYYALKDLSIEFVVQFLEGEVNAYLGAPDDTPEVTLKMQASTLDGMFTGRLNPTRAAMTGKLSFSGDTAKAMTMQKIQKDLTRIYGQAREAVGDPGDLTMLEIKRTEPQARASAPRPVSPAVPAIKRMRDERDELLDVLNELFVAGLITATGGNLSVRTSSSPEHLWITPSQIFKGDLTAEMMVKIDLNGNPIDSDYPASSERFVHCEIMKRRPNVEAVIHTHAPQSSILSLAGLPFVPISTEAAFIGNIPRIPFMMPGTKALGERVADAIEDGIAAIMENHGLIVVGSSLRKAADHTFAIERTSMEIIACHLLGKEPPVLPDEDVETLGSIGEMMA
jgi:autoinducer 2 (AI-2) kinase